MTAPITDWSPYRVSREVYAAWNLGRDAAEAHLPVHDPFPQCCSDCYLAWLLGYAGAPLALIPTPRGACA